MQLGFPEPLDYGPPNHFDLLKMPDPRPDFPRTENRPAKYRNAVVFCCDDGYLPYALVAAAQIDALHAHRDFDIVICGISSLDLPPETAHLNIRTCGIDIGDTFEGLRLDKGKTHVVYLRLAVPHALADDYDRILYLDADIYVQDGDFSTLFQQDLGENAIAAVRDASQWRTPLKTPKQFKRLGIPTAKYFNAGVLLIDVRRYVKDGILAACVDLGRREARRMIRHDQNLLNATLRGKWAELSPVWNFQYSWAVRMFEPMVSPNIVHFIGPRKPWKDKGGHFPPRFARGIGRILARVAPARARPAVQSPPMTQLPLMRKLLWKHWIGAGKIGRYVARFPSDHTVHK